MSNSSTDIVAPNNIPDKSQKAPEFELPDIDMKYRKLSDYKGRNIILAFFPAAESPICTREMCNFRDSFGDLEKYGAVVIGISVDGPFANKMFGQNHHVNFPLLSDYRRQVINNYGIVMKDLGPLTDYNAAKRAIFILDKDQKVQYIWVSDNPLIEPNYDEIKQVLKTL
ncbi:MAG TPA: peroxiredoxin [Nitrososphaeraceae archaeon]